MKQPYFWGPLCLLLCTACNRCEKEPIVVEEYTWGSKLAIKENGVQCIGSINGFPITLWLRGKIEKNITGKDTSFLCVLFVTEGKKPDELARTMQQHQVKRSQEDKNHAKPLDTLLPFECSFINYKRTEHRSEGKVAFSIFSPRNGEGLQLNTKYHVFLAIKAGSNVFYDPDRYAIYETPNPSAITQVAMKDAQCNPSHDANGKLLLSLSMSAQANQISTSGSNAAGFLLIEQEANVVPLDLLEKHLKKRGNSIAESCLHGNKQLKEYEPGIIAYGYGDPDPDGSFSLKDNNDLGSSLKKGAAYNVFALVEQHKKDEFRYFYVSTESREIKIP